MTQKENISTEEKFKDLLYACLNKRIRDKSIILQYPIFINYLKSESEITFINCDIAIDKEKITQNGFNCKLVFYECNFTSDFYLYNLVLENDIIINSCTFNNNRLYIERICPSVTKSASEDLDKKLKIGILNNVNLGIISLNDIRHHNALYIKIETDNSRKMYFEESEINNTPIILKSSKRIEYYNLIINNAITIQNQKKSIKFNNCCFNTTINLSNDFHLILASSCMFKGDFDLSGLKVNNLVLENSTFVKKIELIDSTIKNLSFTNCSFHSTVKIVDIKGLIKGASFARSTIKGMFFFNGFKEETINKTKEQNKIHIKERGKINFSHIFLEPAGYLIIRKTQNGNFIFDYTNILGQLVMQELDIDSLQMHNASIIGSLIVQDIKLKELDLKNTSLIGKLVFNPSDTLNIFDSNIIQNRETAYLLKKGKQEEGDSISASHFKRKELQLYLKDCTSNFNPNKVKECIVLFFNKISNDFGQSWVRGIIFTMSFAYIFYLLINFYGLEKPIFRFAWSLDGFGTAWKEYLKILNVLNFNDKLDNFKFTALGETLFFVSKIFVSYGIYQTVSAFRKFGK